MASAPRLTPSTLNCTPATPTLSEAAAPRFTVPDTVAPAAGAVRLTVGAVVSLATVTLTADEVVVLPAASRARAVSVWVPLADRGGVPRHAVGRGAGVLGAQVGAVHGTAPRPPRHCRRRWR